jgi:chemotaxis protein CheX
MSGVLATLKVFNFEIAVVRDMQSAYRYLDTAPQVALVAADDDMPRERVVELIEHVRARALRVPVIWAGDATAQAATEAVRPDLVVKPGDEPGQIRTELAQLLREHYYPEEMFEALASAVTSVLAESFGVLAKQERSFLKSTRVIAGDITALLTMSGSSIAGYMLVSGTEPTMRALRDRLLPAATHGPAEVADLAGELGNIVLGALKRTLAHHALDFMTSPPVIIEGRDVSVRGSLGGPSMMLEFASDVGTITVELCLQSFDTSSLKRTYPVTVVPAGEVLFL